MKKFLLNLSLIFLFIIPLNVFALSTTEAIEKIDINKKASLTLNYKYDAYNFDNTNVYLYYIAEVTSDYQYVLAEEFLEYPIEINGIKNENDWDILKQTLNAYIEADNIEETYSSYISNNNIHISDLKSGLYFIKTDKIDNEDYSLIFNDFLLNVPSLKNDGTWNYDIVANVKTEIYTPKYENITYSVIKEWKDANKNRPETVRVEIYKDENLVETKVLSQANNWSYNWTALDDGSKWTVVERNIFTGYKVSILEKDNNFIIINTSIEEVVNPQTGDNVNIFFGLLIISLIGFSLVILSLFIKSKKDEKKTS